MSIGRVLNTAFGAIFGNLFVMLGIAFLFAGLPQGIISYFQRSLAPAVSSGAISPGEYFGFIFGAAILNMVFTILAQGALVRATITYSQGERASFGDCLATAFSRVLPLIGLAIVSGLAVAFATLLLIVPGIILALMWYVAAPVVVAEREGVFASLSRSSQLTEGERWNLFVVLLVVFAVWIAIIMLSAIIGGIAGAAGAMAGGGGGGGGVMVLLVAGAGAASATISATVAGALPSAAYVELRSLKEGPETQGLDDIFA